jgi:hypothetical protein
VGEPFLNAEMQSQSQGAVAACSFCGKKGKTYSIEEVADRVATALEDHYSQTQSSRYGDPVLQVIQSVAEIDEEPAREILLVLREREGYTEGEEGKFDDEAHYVDAAASDWELHSEWLDFEKSIKTEARFFSPMAQEILARVFKDVGAEETVNGNPFVVEGGPGKTISALFRARTFQSNGKLEEALCRPDLKIGSPPSDLATAGRMNAHGISVFYGATDPEVAVAEVRPPVGSRVVIGQFLVIRSVRLLDVDALRSVPVKGSVFDPLFIRRRERAKFLERLSHRISMPVMPNDEVFEYLVTQVIADYLASTDLDGVVFPSVQVPGGKNVVLFQGAARVEELPIADGAEVSAGVLHLDEYDPEDEPEVDHYCVWERLPPPHPAGKKAGEGASGGVEILRIPPLPFLERDAREPTLRLNVDQLEVRHVKAVSFQTEAYRVTRHQFQADEGTQQPPPEDDYSDKL